MVATPIGNLRDLTLRALDVLSSVDTVAAEDTRVTARLLVHYRISKPMIALHGHNERRAARRVLALLEEGKSVALVSDAGTPGISDPGSYLVSLAREEGHPVVPVPGPNAAVCALSAAGMETPHFLFYGFLPPKAAARRQALKRLATLPYILIFYEAPHRILECVADLEAVLGAERSLVLARELTKAFETVHACRLGQALAWLTEEPQRQKGEFVLLVAPAPADEKAGLSEDARGTLTLLLEELPPAQAVRLAAAITGEPRNALYELATRLKKGQ